MHFHTNISLIIWMVAVMFFGCGSMSDPRRVKKLSDTFLENCDFIEQTVVHAYGAESHDAPLWPELENRLRENLRIAVIIDSPPFLEFCNYLNRLQMVSSMPSYSNNPQIESAKPNKSTTYIKKWLAEYAFRYENLIPHYFRLVKNADKQRQPSNSGR